MSDSSIANESSCEEEPSRGAIIPIGCKEGQNEELLCLKECLVIGSHGKKHPEGVKVVPKAVIKKETGYLETDLILLTNYCGLDPSLTLRHSYRDKPGKECKKESYVGKIENFLRTCKTPGAILWYTGHGEEHTGNWVFSNGTISFSEIYDLYEKHFHGRLLYIVTDCCYSGQWVLCLAEYLISQGIGACGHCSREGGVLIKVLSACLPHEKAYDGAFSEEGVYIDDTDNRMHFLQTKIHRRQTPCNLDATEICCFTSSRNKCKWPSIPNSINWTWGELANSEQRRSIVNRKRWIRVMVKGKPACRCVLMKSHLQAKFKDKLGSRNIAPADFGHVLYKTRGRDPPSRTRKMATRYSPTVHKEII